MTTRCIESLGNVARKSKLSAHSILTARSGLGPFAMSAPSKYWVNRVSPVGASRKHRKECANGTKRPGAGQGGRSNGAASRQDGPVCVPGVRAGEGNAGPPRGEPRRAPWAAIVNEREARRAPSSAKRETEPVTRGGRGRRCVAAAGTRRARGRRPVACRIAGMGRGVPSSSERVRAVALARLPVALDLPSANRFVIVPSPATEGADRE